MVSSLKDRYGYPNYTEDSNALACPRQYERQSPPLKNSEFLQIDLVSYLLSRSITWMAEKIRHFFANGKAYQPL